MIAFLKQHWLSLILALVIVWLIFKPDSNESTKELKQSVKQAQTDKADIRTEEEAKSATNVIRITEYVKQAHEPQPIINRSIEEDADYILNYGK